ncbi:S1C family serine protease [Chryseobacterium sp. POE27]|uniref:S1C family serine protease n=1 Tax=Chryseobacterium sp. POE27 TaxID=3138177 RepID=UPI003219BF5E
MTLNNYYKEYKYIPIELLIFFSELKALGNGKNTGRTVQEFCDYYKGKYNKVEAPQPQIVAMICDKLVKDNSLTVINRGGFMDMENSYYCLLNDRSSLSNKLIFDLRNVQLSSTIYGFEFIYDHYKRYVIPILNIDNKGDQSIGSAFIYRGGIVTAKHCIEGANKIAVKGISEEDLKSAIFYISPKKGMDLIYIKLPSDITDSIYFKNEVNILEEVMALGYPKIPGFHNFLTAEKATVSARYTATRGAVVSIAEDIWIREDLILITAKIQAGNSGGPIINDKGMVVGVAVNIPTGEGKYDDLGYGTVIPISFADNIIDSLDSELDTSNIEFLNFID